MHGGLWTNRRLTRRQVLHAASAIGLPAALSACGVSTRRPSGSSGVAGGGTRPTFGGTLTVRSFSDVSVLDYAFSHDVYSDFVIGNCVEPLVAHDLHALPRGLLATGWETPDPTTYIFKLRPNVTFQDGTALTSAAAQYSLDRIRGDKTSVRHSDLEAIGSLERPDSLTLRANLSAPFAPLLENLAGDAGRVISPDVGERYGKDRLRQDLSQQGSGPFRFVGWQRADRVTLIRNPAYWGREDGGGALPYLDRVITRVIPDDTVALAALRAGEVDAFRPTEGPPPKDTEAVKRDPTLQYASVAAMGYSYIAFNAVRDPFDRPELRQAVCHAIDRQEIAGRVLYNSVLPMDVIFGPSIWASEPDYHPYLSRDLGAAKRLLTQAGRPNGFAFTLLISAGSPDLQSMAELIQQQLAEAGITMTIQQIEFAKLTQTVSAGEHQAAFLGWTASYDPDDWVYSLFSSKGALSGRLGYKNAEVDRLLDQARITPDAVKRTPLYQRAQRLIAGDAAVCVLYDKLNRNVSARGVHDLPLGPAAGTGLSEVWKSSS